MLRVCIAAAEHAPFAKTGGLADVVAGLSRYLAGIGVDLRVFLPDYRSLKIDRAGVERVDFVGEIPIAMGPITLTASLFEAPVPGSHHRVHLVRCPALYEREGIYAFDGDEHLRFAFFTRAVIESCQRMGFAPDVFHVHDWHTAMLPLYLRTLYAWDGLFERSHTLLTIHNLGYQGVFSADALPLLGLEEHAGMLHQEHLDQGVLSFLETGILHADMLSTVSRTYAREIQEPELGMGLDGLLRARWDHLAGIVNGVDDAAWDPATDVHLHRNYDLDDPSGKASNRAGLLDDLGLAPDPAGPVLGMVTRLTGQKGVELVLNVLPELLGGADVRFCALGSGESRLEHGLEELQRRFPGKVCFYRGYHEPLAHRIEAGSDVFLMPSRFEPCGLNQMYSLRYGTPPVVRRTGGLADTVEHWDPRTRRGTGFLFDHFDDQGLRWALGEMLRAWRDREGWQVLVRNGMRQDFSWERQGRDYLELYARVAGT